MPFLSYQKSVIEAIESAGRFHKEARVDAVKLEGGAEGSNPNQGYCRFGHASDGTYWADPAELSSVRRFQGPANTAEAAMEILADARAVEEAGAFGILLEAIPPEVGKVITETLKIPILDIGAGPHRDGQLLIVSDMLGIFEAFTPRFVKRYATLAKAIITAFQKYVNDVRSGGFPEEQHCYKIKAGEADRFRELLSKSS